MTVALMSWKHRLTKQLFGQYGTTRTLTDKRKPHHVSQHRPVHVAEGLHHPWGSAFLDLGKEHFAHRHELFIGERDSGSGCCGCRCTVAVEEDVSQDIRHVEVSGCCRETTLPRLGDCEGAQHSQNTMGYQVRGG